jgi:MscS family membrane protein
MFDWAENDLFLGNRPGQWLDAALILTVGWGIGKALSWSAAAVFSKLAARTSNLVDDQLVRVLRRPLVTLVTLISLIMGSQRLTVSAQVDRWMVKCFHVAFALAVTWAIVRVVDTLLAAVRRNTKDKDFGRDQKQLLPVMRSSIKILLWGLGCVVALNNAGYDVRALLAGIGIGGLALAMAAKDTLANIFGGVTVFMDKPFRVGDRVRLAGYDGTVEEVGIRSTRIRTLEGPTLVVPNIKFTDTILENVSQEPSRRVRHELGLVCETTPEKLEEAIALLNKLVDDHRSLLEEERLVSFTTFKDFALGIVFIYHIRRGADIFATQNVIHIELMRRFAAAGLLFAYPTQVAIQVDGTR